MAVRETAGEVPIRMGVNLGPVRLVKDLNAQLNIIGDGINVAQRVMSFSDPGQLLVSRSFYEVVRRAPSMSPGRSTRVPSTPIERAS